MGTATVAEPLGYAPDSVFAEWSDEERAAADRIEEESNDRRAGVLALRDANEHHSVHGLPDDSLRHLAKLYRRELEDIEDGDLVDDSKTGKRTKLVKAKIADIEAEQAYRAALAESWCAAEDGTHSVTAFFARGHLTGVIYHGATPPSYDLARKLDERNWLEGKPHVLNWGEATDA